jgi:amino acid adenylation domain-containing protein
MGMVVLKRLEDALADGDNTWAVIKGFAVNNDGDNKVSYSAPSVDAQTQVVVEALSVADVHPETIQYIETHGTGTNLGDPIEITALNQAFHTQTYKKHYCAIGSVKSNIGHLDNAAGIAGLIKTTLALKHKKIPASLHFETPNPNIDFENSPFFVNTQLREWKRDRAPRRAGVTSLGMGGTNAHVILEEAPGDQHASKSVRPCISKDCLILLSAQTESAREKITENLSGYMQENPDLNLADVAYTLSMGRRDFNYRRMVLCREPGEFITALEDLTPGVVFDSVCDIIDRPVVFMFPGQGAQYVNMGKKLYQKEPLYKEYMDKCAELLIPLLGIDPREVIYPDGSSSLEENGEKLRQTWLTQPVLFMLEYSLAQVWMDWGIMPMGMIGHSIGEFTAASISGCMSLEDALKLVAARGRLMHEQEKGAMLSVGLNESQIRGMLGDDGDDLFLAAVNSPKHCVVSGRTRDVEKLGKQLSEKNIYCRLLHTSHAFHSPLMEPMIKEFTKIVEKIKLNAPTIPFISCITGTWIRDEEACSPQYWAKQLRKPVRFSDGIQEILRDPSLVLLEVGPGSSLSVLTKEYKKNGNEPEPLIFSSIRQIKQTDSDMAFLLKTLGNLWLSGVIIDWKNYYKNEKRCRVPLPTYPFERKHYWLEMVKEPMQATAVNMEEEKVVVEPGLAKEQKKQTGTFTPRPKLPVEYVAPNDDIEASIVEIWEELLGIKPIGTEDNFFDLGGHSLLATTFLSHLQEKFHMRLGLKSIFEASTVAGIALILNSKLNTANEIASPVSPKDEAVYGIIPSTKDNEFYPLTSTQKRQFILNRIDGNTTNYTLTRTYLMEGQLDLEKLQKSIQTLIMRQEILRTSFCIVDSQPMQKINDSVDFAIDYVEAKNNNEEEIVNNFVRPYQLSEAPLFRIGVVKIETGKYILINDMHHIISDGTSMNIFVKELADLYQDKSLGRLKINYKDFSQWQYEFQETEMYKTQENYWLKKFEQQISRLNLPMDFSRPPIQLFEGETLYFELDSQITGALKELMTKTNTTLYMVLLTIFHIFLAKITGQRDIIIGTVVAGRDYHVELQKIIGMFLNTLVLKHRINYDETVNRLVVEIKEETLRIFENQNYPFENIVDKVSKNRDTSRNPIFDVMYVLQNFRTYEVSLPHLKIKHVQGIYKDTTAKVDLLLNSVEHKGKIYLLFEYCTRLFKRSTIERFIKYFKEIALSISRDPNEKIVDIDIMPREERNQVLSEFNRTQREYSTNITIQELFENQVDQTSYQVAVVDGMQEITYNQLNKRSNRLAHYLRDVYHVKPNDVIGISMDRSLEMVVAILAIVKSGAGYVAIDPNYPKDRVLHILKDSGTQRVIADILRDQLFDDFSGEIISMGFGRHKDNIALKPMENLEIVNRPENLLYVIYTSGTTGIPNGAKLSHDLLANLVQWQKNESSIDCSLRCLQFTSINFCVSFQEIMCTLTSGGEIYLIGDLQRQDIEYLMGFLCRHHIEVLYLPFSYLNFLFNESNRWNESFDHNLKHIITAGEQLKISFGLRLFLENNPGLQLHNHYGSSEMHVVTSYTLDYSTVDTFPIPPVGTPIANTRIFILDDELKPVPIGVWGGLFIESRQELLGYINNDELTNNKLEWLPQLSEKRLYRSGDVGRWLEDGHIEIRGRKDEQVKIRGFRVEPGEIESKIFSIDGVKDCVVVVKENKTKQKNLYAYVVVDNANISTIKIALSRFLPHHMIPQLVELESLPLMPNGKVDREKLPESQIDIGTEFTPPGTENEEIIADIWKEVLDLEMVGIHHNFFDLGGNSLTIISVHNHLKERLKRDIPVIKMFEYVTIRELVEYLEDTGERVDKKKVILAQTVSKARTRIKRIVKHR